MEQRGGVGLIGGNCSSSRVVSSSSTLSTRLRLPRAAQHPDTQQHNRKNPRNEQPVPAEPACPAARLSPGTRCSKGDKLSRRCLCSHPGGHRAARGGEAGPSRGAPLTGSRSGAPPWPPAPLRQLPAARAPHRRPVVGSGSAPTRRPAVQVEDPPRWSGPGRGRRSRHRPRSRPARTVSQQPAALAGGKQRRAAGDGRRGGSGRRRLTYGVEDADGGLAVGGEQGLGALELQHRRRRHLTAPSVPPHRQPGNGLRRPRPFRARGVTGAAVPALGGGWPGGGAG